ncbi:hypothetical protein PP352_21460 [Mycobacteroides abscessus]|nr:hypothetical protein [Mycobacteroides abscessus]
MSSPLEVLGSGWFAAGVMAGAGAVWVGWPRMYRALLELRRSRFVVWAIAHGLLCIVAVWSLAHVLDPNSATVIAAALMVVLLGCSALWAARTFAELMVNLFISARIGAALATAFAMVLGVFVVDAFYARVAAGLYIATGALFLVGVALALGTYRVSANAFYRRLTEHRKASHDHP